MDSLSASYASSDDEEGEQRQIKETDSESLPTTSIPKPSSSIFDNLPPPRSKPSLFSTLPPPKTSASSSSYPSLSSSSSSSSSSLFSSIPHPKSQNPIPSSNPPIPSSPPKTHQIDSESTQSKQTKPIFSSLLQPKSQNSLNPIPKRVVQFTLPLNPSLLKPNDLDDDDDDDQVLEERKPIMDSSNSSSSKALSSMLPAPKNSFGLAPGAKSRRSAFDSNVSSSKEEESTNLDQLGISNVEEKERSNFDHQESSNAIEEQERSNFEGNSKYPLGQGINSYENHGSYDGDWATNDGSLESSYYGTSYESSGGGDYGVYNNVGNWSDGSVAMEVQPVVQEMERIVGKRKRNEIPAEIVEVNQAELMKNRPREDQVKVTGIAFGPAYQPASTSKGKPSKLHKRKHQIGSLYFDMKQKEMELAERRARGFLTKSETQAKYGW